MGSPSLLHCALSTWLAAVENAPGRISRPGRAVYGQHSVCIGGIVGGACSRVRCACGVQLAMVTAHIMYACLSHNRPGSSRPLSNKSRQRKRRRTRDPRPLPLSPLHLPFPKPLPQHRHHEIDKEYNAPRFARASHIDNAQRPRSSSGSATIHPAYPTHAPLRTLTQARFRTLMLELFSAFLPGQCSPRKSLVTACSHRAPFWPPGAYRRGVGRGGVERDGCKA